jgi:hypothetical protein
MFEWLEHRGWRRKKGDRHPVVGKLQAGLHLRVTLPVMRQEVSQC